MKVKCPTCKQTVDFAPSNTFRPFCSERCQTLDLGAWADEQYKVPVGASESSTVNEKSLEDSGSHDAPLPKELLN